MKNYYLAGLIIFNCLNLSCNKEKKAINEENRTIQKKSTCIKRRLAGRRIRRAKIQIITQQSTKHRLRPEKFPFRRNLMQIRRKRMLKQMPQRQKWTHRTSDSQYIIKIMKTNQQNMNQKVSFKLIAVVIGLTSLSIPSCGTVQGVGKDVEHAGNHIEKVARDNSHH